MQLVKAPGTYQHQPIVVPTGTCNGRRTFVKEEEDSFSDDDDTTEYVREYQLQELAKYEDALESKTKTCSLSMVSGVTDYGEASANPENKTETLNRIHNDYVFLQPTRDKLPIDTKKHDIMTTLQLTNVVIIQGETGCGKTTQVPQFILDDYTERKEYCNIVVTQPRKLAAISVAKHVSSERGWPIGSIVGYQVGLDRVAGPDTLLTYMTAGVLLQKIIMRKDLNEFTHVIIDEVHERTQEMDFLFILLRRFLYTNSLGVKVILMSATFNTIRFSNYFKKIVGGVSIPAMCIEVNKSQTSYARSVYYIDEMSALGEVFQNYDSSEPHIPKSTYDIFVQLVLALSQVDTDEEKIGHVLVFLPGIFEIEEAYKVLMAESKKGRGNFMIVPLHSSIPGHEQGRVFTKPAPGVRKIILSTNIAESSITVPDIVYVIDFCMTKTLEVQSNTQYQSLVLSWASKTNCIQRAGRVGRVCPGRVYRLVSRDFYEQLPDDITPEMLRAPLERVVLFSKKLELSELPQSILALAMDPPYLGNIRATVRNLKEVGALLPTCRGQPIEGDGDITMLGTLMWNLPIDVQLSKMIALGYMFSCLEECIIMAAGCSMSNIFSTPFRERLNAYGNKLFWADGSCSDLIAHLKLYETYQNNKNTGAFSNIRAEKEWCRSNYLSDRSMREWICLVTEIKTRLEAMNIRATLGPQHVVLSDTDKSMILKTVIAGAFYPNYFSRSCDAGQVDEQQVCKMLRGLDHHSTVYFTNMDLEQPGPLYEQRIREFFRNISNEFLIYFDGGRIYINFNTKQKQRTVDVHGRKYVTYMPGNIMAEVYKSVMMRRLRMPVAFPVMASKLAWEMAKKMNLATDKDGHLALIQKPMQKKVVGVLPGLRQASMFILLWHVIDAGHFYAQPANKDCVARVDAISLDLNNKEAPLDLVDRDNIAVDGLYACKYTDDVYYRCRVMAMMPIGQSGIRIQVIYIDYGNTASVSPNDLYQLPSGVARLALPQAMECVLSGVQPIATFNPHGTWPEAANKLVRDLTADVVLRADIFSVVNDVLSVKLYRRDEPMSINQLLIDEKLGERHEEAYLSKENHHQRELAQRSMNGVEEGTQLTQPMAASGAQHVEAPRWEDCRREINLRGPYSPLEMKVFAMNKGGGNVNIEQNSINTVLLDHEPQDPHERMLVASCISKSPHGESLSLRHTTLMPSSRGLPAILSMLFAPQVQIKASTDGTSYALALCGLGVDARKKPIYPEHDLKAVFDVEFSQQDLIRINEMRYIMNRLIDIMHHHSTKVGVQPHQYHRQLKERLLTLLAEQRESKEREHVRYSDSWTKHAYNGTAIAPDSSYRKTGDIWPLHVAVELRDKNDENVQMQKHFEELQNYTRGYKPMPDRVLCLFCNVEVATQVGLRAHTLTTKHIDSTQIIRTRINRY